MNRNSKDTALITGASSGIGAICADRLARRGHDLILVARDRVRLQAVATHISARTGRSVEAIAADPNDREDLARVKRTLRSDESITVLVNSAGVGAPTPLQEEEADAISLLLDEPKLKTRNMLTELTRRVKKDRAGVSQSEKHTRATRITALPPRSESWQENLDAIEWASASIVHDLRNPLGAIYAAAEMLIHLDPGTTHVQRLATNIFRAAGRMRELLEDLNSLAYGNTPMTELCDIREVIAAAANAASAAAQNGRVQIVLEVPEAIKLSLRRTRMQSVFLNLIANALEAMPTGGKLRVVARKAGNCVLIEIEDTGPGIPRGIRDRLFEPFVTAGKQHGLGLGLALSRQTVLNHGGDIWTEPASGARFVIRLPLNRARSSQNVHMLSESSTPRRSIQEVETIAAQKECCQTDE